MMPRSCIRFCVITGMPAASRNEDNFRQIECLAFGGLFTCSSEEQVELMSILYKVTLSAEGVHF